MIPYFGGAELSYYREFMHENGVQHMAFNWLNHQRRIKSRDWRIADYFPEDARIFVDSGAATYNREGVNVPWDEVKALADDYYAFISDNIDRVNGFLEFDAECLNDAQMDEPRRSFDREKYVAVWHVGDGVEMLHSLAESFDSIAIAERANDENQLAKTYRHIARQTRLHLIGADRSLLDAHIKWSSCHFSAWYSAQQRGETFIWVGHQLRRYMPDRRDIALKKYRPLLETLGLDVAALAAGDAKEGLKLAVWSWRQYFANLDDFGENGPIPHPVTQTLNHVSRENADSPPTQVAETDPEWRNDVVTQRAAQEPENRPKTLWPGVATEAHTVWETDPEEGVKKPRTELRAKVGGNVMQCTGCFLASGCPSYNPGSKCAYNFVLPMSSKEQYAAGVDELIAIEGGRMRFGVAVEQAQGGFPTKEVSQEIDRYARLLKIKNDMERDTFTLTVKAQQSSNGAPGILSRLFGRNPEPVAGSSNRALETAGVIDAEIVAEGSEVAPVAAVGRDRVTESVEDRQGTGSSQN